jgi:hypothetical protein
MEKYVVMLEKEERAQLEVMVSKGTHAAQKVLTALILVTVQVVAGPPAL